MIQLSNQPIMCQQGNEVDLTLTCEPWTRWSQWLWENCWSPAFRLHYKHTRDDTLWSLHRTCLVDVCVRSEQNDLLLSTLLCTDKKATSDIHSIKMLCRETSPSSAKPEAEEQRQQMLRSDSSPGSVGWFCICIHLLQPDWLIADHIYLATVIINLKKLHS